MVLNDPFLSSHPEKSYPFFSSLACVPGLTELCLAELGLTVLGLTELGLTELGLTELGLTEFGLTELGLTELGLTELGLTELGLTELGLTELGLTELGLAELGLAELGKCVNLAACISTSYFLWFFYTLNIIYIRKAIALDQPLPAKYFVLIYRNSKYYLPFTSEHKKWWSPIVPAFRLRIGTYYAAFISITSPLRHPTFSTRTFCVPELVWILVVGMLVFVLPIPVPAFSPLGVSEHPLPGTDWCC
ncbi:Pc21g03710 [Penicillium rubens Wisconsin 54-1255]|uniref:Pc21g03710 protein n=1 Tax=Penicillium rubens (strain ATCC 28089 / DSM 1075 / NRRL 1951 / Wisconsin 54-1255) TaxID=500485 RepID=B6HLI2_PENRW|nr:Pc21g03710 [Penicillium rubens Wisconsin 54-1255]